jgi:hypothetical protein
MLFLISNLIVEITLSGIWWIVRNSIYGISSYLWGLVYHSKSDNKFHINETKWNELIEQNKLQQKEIHDLRKLIENWRDIKSSKIYKKNETEEDITNELTNYLSNSIMMSKKDL